MNLKYHIYEASAEYGRRGGLHRRENVQKQGKTVQNSDFGAKTTVTALKIQNFEFRASSCNIDLKYWWGASTDEKRRKIGQNSAKQ